MTTPFAFEPFRTKTVEPIQMTTRPQRRAFLQQADHNLFRLRSDQVMVDLLTDSGTGAMSSAQWAAMMRGDESYAGSLSFHRLTEVVARITGLPYMLPTHQGRIAERLLVEAIIGKPPAGNGMVVPNNAHFDTTRSMIETSNAEAVNLLSDAEGPAPFKGNMDLRKLERLLQPGDRGGRGDDVPFVMMTVTCNSNGGQPVSLANLRNVREVCDRFGKLLFLDACRYAENAWFIKQREPGMRDRSIASIVRDMFDLCDGAVMSTRKDALCNVGGLLLMRDERRYRKACNLCVLTEGFQMTYGSLPARDLEAIAVGLQESLDEAYLAARCQQVADLARRLTEGGVKVIEPCGGHAVFLDAENFCPHLGRADSPAHSLACAIYEHAGVRCSRIGSALTNARGEPMELVRLAVPRRVYSAMHLAHVADAIISLKQNAASISAVPAAVPGRVRCQEPELELV